MWYYLIIGGWALGYLAGVSVAWTGLGVPPAGRVPVGEVLCGLLALGLAAGGGATELTRPGERQAIARYLASRRYGRAAALGAGTGGGLAAAAGTVAAFWAIGPRLSWWHLGAAAIPFVGLAAGIAAFFALAGATAAGPEAAPDRGPGGRPRAAEPGAAADRRRHSGSGE